MWELNDMSESRRIPRSQTAVDAVAARGQGEFAPRNHQRGAVSLRSVRNYTLYDLHFSSSYGINWLNNLYV